MSEARLTNARPPQGRSECCGLCDDEVWQSVLLWRRLTLPLGDGGCGFSRQCGRWPRRKRMENSIPQSRRSRDSSLYQREPWGRGMRILTPVCALAQNDELGRLANLNYPSLVADLQQQPFTNRRSSQRIVILNQCAHWCENPFSFGTDYHCLSGTRNTDCRTILRNGSQ